MRTCTLADVTEVVGRMERVSRWLEKQEQLVVGLVIVVAVVAAAVWAVSKM